MKHMDILYGLELLIYKYKRKESDDNLLDRLMELGYVDLFGWFNEDKGRHVYELNVTQKGLLYYATKKSKRKPKLVFLLAIAILIIPYVVILLGL